MAKDRDAPRLTVVIEPLAPRIYAILFRRHLHVDPRCEKQKAIDWALACLAAGIEESYLRPKARTNI